MLGEIFTADEALRLGIVDQVAAKGEGLAAAKHMAAKLAVRGPLATAVTKMLINAAEGEDVERALEDSRGVWLLRMAMNSKPGLRPSGRSASPTSGKCPFLDISAPFP